MNSKIRSLGMRWMRGRIMKGDRLDDRGLLFCRLTFFAKIPIDGNWRSLNRTDGGDKLYMARMSFHNV
jgi:hypothetical protein